MIHPAIHDKIFVLDAKYYKAGADLKEGNMPGGESILKQIVYYIGKVYCTYIKKIGEYYNCLTS